MSSPINSNRLERIDDLMTHDLKIIQSEEVFSFSLDAVLLARFVSIQKQGRCLDLCTGNGVIPLLLSTRTEAIIHGIEIQDRLADMASRSVELNQLTHKIHIHQSDLKSYHVEPDSKYDVITVNPPYLPLQSGDIKLNSYQAMARHELGCTLEDVVAACARLIKPKGKVAMVHRPTRLTEIISMMRKYNLEPKRMRFVHPHDDAEANMVLIEALQGGKPEVRLLPPLIVYNKDNQYQDELLEIYYGKKGKLDESI